MMQWLVYALMTAAAIFVVLWPLSRRTVVGASGSDLLVYRDQLDEIARDRAAGLIGEREADAARIEVSRRLLAAADASKVDAADALKPAAWRRRVAAGVALIGLPVGAGGLYLLLGSPNLPDQPLAARALAPGQDASVQSLITQVEQRLESHPDEPRGWVVIAPIYMRLGRFDDAVNARRNALRLLGESADREADLGEAMVAAADGVVTAEAKAAFDRAHALDAQHIKAQFYLGMSAEQDGKPQEAATIWRDLLGRAPPGAPWAELVRQSLARVDPQGAPVPTLAPKAPGPGASEAAAAAGLPPEQRIAMIRGMVEQLVERLRHDGADIDGWLRLVRSYAVLGEREKALNAAGDARRALASDAGKVQRLDELVKSLGLD
ncbi:MAG TPA: c-type cytochrome biogenesis protein CcmI [Xanthobacteraceae bacterium]|nr:c-type cytochrome biogenesis protein CcmI [Xanthobacteraceae bacterium]